MFAHCLYNNDSYSHFKFEIFFIEFKKNVGLGGVNPTGHRH